jgi:4-hydroxyacetophenone monooxygenase
MTRPLVDAPITEDDAFLAAALEHASVSTLMMSIVHLTGDTRLLHGPIRPSRPIPGEVDGGMSDAEKAAVRSMGFEALRAYRDRGGTLPPAPAPGTIRQMMSFMVGEEVPDEYVPMMLEEMALDGGDGRDVAWDDVPVGAARRLPRGRHRRRMSGLLAAIRLEEAGVYRCSENEGVGGTWFENSYPGCRVDVANHFYCYSFAPNHGWTEFFARRGELRAYFERCATEFGVRDKIRFRSAVVGARFDETSQRWSVRVRGGDGREETIEANAIISGVGQLNRPKIQQIGRASCRERV